MISKNFFLQIKEQNLKTLLLKKENISALEELLYTESKKLELLKKQKRKLDFGKEVDYSELEQLVLEIKKEVDNFLDIRDITLPRFKYFSILDQESRIKNFPTSSYTIFFYFMSVGSMGVWIGSSFTSEIQLLLMAMYGINGKILHKIMNNSKYFVKHEVVQLKKEKSVNLIPVIAHEYTHHIQFKKDFVAKEDSMFMEGHARGVQRYIAKTYREKEDNDAFLYDILNWDVGEIKSAYIWACKKIKNPIRKSLLRIGTSRDIDEKICRITERNPTEHALGNAFFSIYENDFGDQIYKEMIHGNFKIR